MAQAGGALFVPLRVGGDSLPAAFSGRQTEIVPAALGDYAPLLGAVVAAAERK